MSEQEKRDALAALLRSEGWRHLKGFAVSEFGAVITLELIAQKPDELPRLLAKREAIDLLLGWPEREIAKIDKAIARGDA